ncbi:hypothetical protein [Ferrimonas marina]|uniref:Uncharacterized protein n=1 Tax=Ferrimonas marina TaxID=299255 RepID=A0A1M5MMD6_9GAMM|nr:hypothetical protein [Ferrimonas marina]SHG78540.1 hypothetical protein SAMN02745129_0703 [Ferrimonas marina]
MNQTKLIIIAICAGLLIGAIATFFFGYVAAIAIPEGYFLWFHQHMHIRVAFIPLGIAEHFICFGPWALLAGCVLARLSPSHWLLNSVICYLSVLFYSSVGIAIVYGGPIRSPFQVSDSVFYIPMMVLPTCLIAASYFSSKRHGHKEHHCPT